MTDTMPKTIWMISHQPNLLVVLPSAARSLHAAEQRPALTYSGQSFRAIALFNNEAAPPAVKQ